MIFEQPNNCRWTFEGGLELPLYRFYYMHYVPPVDNLNSLKQESSLSVKIMNGFQMENALYIINPHTRSITFIHILGDCILTISR